MSEEKIPLDEAIRLCDIIVDENHNKMISFGKWMCWGCRKFTKKYEERCFYTEDGSNNGCYQINKIFRFKN